MPKIRIMLDPGHSKNYNRGAVAGYYESNAMYDLALYLKTALEEYGIFDVRCTKEKLDRCPSLAARGKAGWSTGSRLLLSLHSNGANGQAYGVTSFISLKRNSKAFAEAIDAAVVAQFKAFGQAKSYDRGAVTRAGSSGVNDYYGLLRNGVLNPGCQHVILVEHGFHDNVADCTCLAKTDFLEAVAKAEAKVIYDELKQYYVGNNVTTYYGKTTTTLNVRAGAGADTTLMGTLPAGSGVQIISIDGTWARIIYNDSMCFVNKNYLAIDNEKIIPVYANVKNPLPKYGVVETVVDTPENYVVFGEGIVTASELNVRCGPGTNNASFGCISKGTMVKVCMDEKAIGTNWFRIGPVVINGKNITGGYVSRDYVEVRGINDAKQAVVNTKVLNVREGPGTQYRITGNFNMGDVVYVIPDDNDTDGWARVITTREYDEMYKSLTTPDGMYVSEKYLVYNANVALTGTAESAKEQKKMPFGVATVTTGLNVRSGPGTSYSKITTLNKGSTVILNGHLANGWAEIIYKGKLEYVSEKYLNILNDIGVTFDDIVMDDKVAKAVEALPESHAVEWLSDILNGRLTSKYGSRVHPITGAQSFHGGVDIGANGGTPIYSTVDGFCAKNVYDNSYGNLCVIIATDGSCHYFAHMKSAAIPKVGDLVHAGMKIGYVGTTGASTGNHLHYEIRLDGTTASRVNPEDYEFAVPMMTKSVTA